MITIADIFTASIKQDLNSSSFERLLGLLPPEEHIRITRYKQLEDRQRALLGAILVRSVISIRSGLKIKDISLSRDEYGKPFLKDIEDVHFNLSHSGDWVVCIIGNAKVGIDIEEMKQIDIGLGEHFFSDFEYEALKKLPEKRHLDRFYELWTLKESYIKAIGKGLSIPLKAFSIEVGIKDIKLHTQSDGDFTLKLYEIAENYKLAACTKEDILPDTVKVVDILKTME